MTDKPAESAVERAIYVIESAESEGRITYEEEMTVRAALAELKAKLAAAEAQRCDTCAHCAECDIQQMLSPFIEDWGDTFCSSWTDRKQDP